METNAHNVVVMPNAISINPLNGKLSRGRIQYFYNNIKDNAAKRISAYKKQDTGNKRIGD